MLIKGQPLNIVLHQEALVDVQSFLQTLQKKLDALTAQAKPPGAELEPPKQLDRRSSRVSVASSTKSSSKAGTRKPFEFFGQTEDIICFIFIAKVVKKTKFQAAVDERIINMKLEAAFSGLYVSIETSKTVITAIHVEGMISIFLKIVR